MLHGRMVAAVVAGLAQYEDERQQSEKQDAHETEAFDEGQHGGLLLHHPEGDAEGLMLGGEDVRARRVQGRGRAAEQLAGRRGCRDSRARPGWRCWFACCVHR